MGKTPRVLIIDDDRTSARVVETALLKEGFIVDWRGTGEKGLEAIEEAPPDLILLDVGLPGIDGFEVLRRVRAQQRATKVILLTARREEFDRVLGLELGGDDYVTKPFFLRELVARIKARLRPADVAADSKAPPTQIQLEEVRVDLRRGTVSGPRGEQRLTTIEAALLGYLISQAGRSVSREEILRNVWEEAASLTLRKVDNVVKKLRAKLGDSAATPRHIVTIHGTGYRFEP